MLFYLCFVIVRKRRLFLVEEGSLLELASKCPKCAHSCLADVVNTSGSLIKIQRSCAACLHTSFWSSQSIIGHVAHGNIAVSCAILFSFIKHSQDVFFYECANDITHSFYASPTLLSTSLRHGILAGTTNMSC